jgi:hypothetical protein
MVNATSAVVDVCPKFLLNSDVSDVTVCSKCIQLKDQLEYLQMELKSLHLAAKLLQDSNVQSNTEPLVELCNAVHTNKETMSASKGVCKDLLKDTSVLQDNIMDYKSDIDNLKSILHSIKNRQIADVIVLTIGKFSSRCIVTKEDSTSTIKGSNIVAGRRISQHNFKTSTLREIPTMFNGLVVSKMEENRLSSNLNTSRMCKISVTKPENKDHYRGQSCLRLCS